MNVIKRLTEQRAQEVFDGVMLSDGHLCCRNKRSTYFSIDLSGQEHLDWLELIKAALIILGLEVPPHQPHLYKGTSRGKLFLLLSMRTYCSPYLAYPRQRWYPDGKKIVPADLQLTPFMLANEMMGDGSSGWNKTGYVFTYFATQGFDLDSIVRLEEKLHRIGLETGRSHNGRVVKGSGIKVTVKGESIGKLMSMVAPYIVPSYQYKIKYKLDLLEARK